MAGRPKHVKVSQGSKIFSLPPQKLTEALEKIKADGTVDLESMGLEPVVVVEYDLDHMKKTHAKRILAEMVPAEA